LEARGRAKDDDDDVDASRVRAEIRGRGEAHARVRRIARAMVQDGPARPRGRERVRRRRARRVRAREGECERAVVVAVVVVAVMSDPVPPETSPTDPPTPPPAEKTEKQLKREAEKRAKKEAEAAKKAAKLEARQIRGASSGAAITVGVVPHPPVDLEPPSGTRDFYPEDMRLQRWLFDKFRAIGDACGFEEYDAPVLERQELYKRKAGEEITSQMYAFVDQEGHEVTLRPEMTPSLARMVLGRAQSHVLPLKWYSVPQCWRFETTQRGRKREHYQWNMDVVGCPSINAEVELLYAICAFFTSIGITSKDIGIKINSRKVMASVLKAMGVSDDAFAPVCVVMDKFDKIGAAATEEELVSTQGLDAATAKKIVSCLQCATVDDLTALCGDGVDTGGVDELKKLFELADAYGFGDWLVFDASVVRGLAYYTGVVFEGFDRAGELRAICGGGRYDRLLSLYGAVSEVPAVGFGFGDCVVVELLKDKGILPSLPKKIDFVVAAFNPSMQGAAMKTASLMRAGGAKVDLLLEPKKKVTATFDYANRVGARYIVFVAPAEWEKGEVRVKDLRLGEDVDDALKQVDVAVKDLGRVHDVLDAWALSKEMAARATVSDEKTEN